MKKHYLYPLWIRLWHWTNALLCILLIISGVSVHYGSQAFEISISIHNISGIVLSILWLIFIIGNMTSKNSQHYKIKFKGLFKRIVQQSYYYGIGIFKGEPHPYPVSAEMKFNSLQQLTYIAVMYGLMPILIGSGLLFLFFVGTFNIWLIAITHLIVAYLIILFMVTHLYIITTGDTILSNFRAMITGWDNIND
ncbi:MAG: cytochrome b/b6 domain-containing protein [Thiomargarita sp.]|nr:cytochrome b/b6 domain-containing protein [Thiomargarita sp.]